MAKTILLVEDNPDIQKANKRMLSLHDYAVETAMNFAEAQDYLEDHRPDLLVLDIMLPDGNGLALCEELRKKSDIPILFLSAMNEKADIITGLRTGGDDYLSKPYDYGEFLARIEALLRRSERSTKHNAVYGAMTVDYNAARVYIDGKDMLLKPREFALLRLLLERAETFVSAEMMFEKIWGGDPGDDIRTVYVHIANLRKKLNEQDVMPIYIDQERGKGYRLVLPGNRG